MNSGPDVEENMRAVREYTAYAAAEGAKFIMFRKPWIKYRRTDGRKHAERIPGYVTRTFAGLARRHGVYIHCGSITEAAPGGRPFNTTLLFAPDGQIRALYRKLHLFDVELENGPSFRESDETPVPRSWWRSHTLHPWGLFHLLDIRFRNCTACRCRAVRRCFAWRRILPGKPVKTLGDAAESQGSGKYQLCAGGRTVGMKRASEA